MNQKLYDMMDWARIEVLVYSEEDNPHEVLGASVTDDGILVQAFFPSAQSVTIHTNGSDIPMEMEDESGFFAMLLPGNCVPEYTLKVCYSNGVSRNVVDPYNYGVQIPEKVLKKFRSGICYDIYNYLGCHKMNVNGTEGMYFAVWAPNAVRVSLVGDFNRWDGRCLPMRRLKEYGIFELFVPNMKTGLLYKYEVKAKHGLTYLKSDPYGFNFEKRPDTATITSDLSSYKWGDQAWMTERNDNDTKVLPMAVYQVHLASWAVPENETRNYYNYRELAKLLSDYVKKMGYTHVELYPVMEYPDDQTYGFSTTGFFAPTSRFGSAEDFMYFVDYLHRHEIGVILVWVPSHFPRNVDGLIGFDGTNLYEHNDSRKALFAPDGGLIFNYARPEVKNFLIASALFWANVYHADGLRIDNLSCMLYLDYSKGPGQWVPNLYGGNENLDAVEFFKHLDSIFHTKARGSLLLAEDSSQWPRVTSPVEDGGLGFDYKWNSGFRSTIVEYIQLDPIFRGPHHQELIFSMVYNYSEDFILALGIGDVTEKVGSMYSKVPGRHRNKFSNLRVLYGYMFLHPGKKLLAQGCDIAQKAGLSPLHGTEWSSLDHKDNLDFQTYMSELLKFYRESPALYALDYDPDGFEWINNISANENMLVFLRKTGIEEQTLLAVVNFSNLVYENHMIGVPFCGKYKEIFNSDAIFFGGEGNTNPRVKNSKEDECDEFPNSIRITVPAMGICVFSCTRSERLRRKTKVRNAEKKDISNDQQLAAVKDDASMDYKERSDSKIGEVENTVRKKSLREELEEKVIAEEHR